jgi:hypothetical protein
MSNLSSEYSLTLRYNKKQHMLYSNITTVAVVQSRKGGGAYFGIKLFVVIVIMFKYQNIKLKSTINRTIKF